MAPSVCILPKQPTLLLLQAMKTDVVLLSVSRNAVKPASSEVA
jgi:hypothetical protein